MRFKVGKHLLTTILITKDKFEAELSCCGESSDFMLENIDGLAVWSDALCEWFEINPEQIQHGSTVWNKLEEMALEQYLSDLADAADVRGERQYDWIKENLKQ